MALTLAKEAYITLLEAKKTPAAESGPHYERMQRLLAEFKAKVGGGWGDGWVVGLTDLRDRVNLNPPV